MGNANRPARAKLFSLLWRQTIKAAVLLHVGAMLALVAATRLPGTPSWPFEALGYLPYLVHLVPAGLLLILSWPLGARWRLLSSLGVLLLVVIAMDLKLNLGASVEGRHRLRLMTYNIQAFVAREQPGGLARIAWEVALHDPDVLLLQDAAIADGENRPRPGAEAIIGRRFHASSGQYVIASRFPLKECRDGNLSFPGESHHYFRCVAVVGDVEVELVTAHLLSPRAGLNAIRHRGSAGVRAWTDNLSHRAHQATALASDLAAISRPLILAGDFNASQYSAATRALARIGLRDAFALAGLGYGYTQGHTLRPGVSFLRIDRILVGGDIAVADAFVGGASASDHRPVIADLVLVPD